MVRKIIPVLVGKLLKMHAGKYIPALIPHDHFATSKEVVRVSTMRNAREEP
jgi:hypothetical protein